MGLDKFGVSRTYKKTVNMVVEDFKIMVLIPIIHFIFHMPLMKIWQ